VRTIQIEVRPLGGDSLKVTLDASKPTVGELKAEIARSQGTAEILQELYNVVMRADGRATREDDAEPELLDDAAMVLGEGAVVTLAVKEPPFLWRTFPEKHMRLSEGGALATAIADTDNGYALVTSGTKLTKGRHYWEVEVLSETMGNMIGVTRPGLNPLGSYIRNTCTDGWSLSENAGGLWGNGKGGHNEAGHCKQGDRVGVLLDLSDGSLLFFKNGVKHGPGYPPGSVTGPVVAAVQMCYAGRSARLHSAVAFPAEHPQ
jgi:hypothetical protein